MNFTFWMLELLKRIVKLFLMYFISDIYCMMCICLFSIGCSSKAREIPTPSGKNLEMQFETSRQPFPIFRDIISV